MKKITALTLLTGLVAASQVTAANYDLYLTGSTAFRANAFAACQKLYDGGAPASANDGTANPPASGDSQWTFTGTATNLNITSGTDTLTIHALWTGSVQGLSALLNKDQLVFLASATQGSTTLVTNSSSAAFSDVFSSVTLDPLPSGSFTEKKVAVQPFVFVKSTAPGGVQSITNITWQQLNTFLGSAGSVPLSYLTGRASDATTNIYLVHRTLDSGTRVTTVQEAKYFGSVTVNYYDPTTDAYYAATTNMGPAAFGPGYVSGGNVKTVMQYANPGNQGIAYLSMSDAKGITGTAWQNILAYNGNYPIAGYVPGSAPTTNDYSPVIWGKYSFWAFECLDAPKTSQWSTYTDQNLSFTQLNNIISKLSGTGAGSIDFEIANSETNTASSTFPATAIRLSEMQVSRAAVGGVIAP
jgi:hypothetical protein